jgi:hypothetical protein
MTIKILGVACVAAAIASTSAFAAPANPPPGCRAWNADLPKEWQSWADTPAPLTAATAPAGTDSAKVAIGKRVSLTMAPAQSVHLAVDMPTIDDPPDSHSGLIGLHVTEAGNYWVAASGGVWIDIVVDGAIIDPIETDGGPLCANLSKALEYRLKAGDSVIQLIRARGAHVDLMVAREP